MKTRQSQKSPLKNRKSLRPLAHQAKVRKKAKKNNVQKAVLNNNEHWHSGFSEASRKDDMYQIWTSSCGVHNVQPDVMKSWWDKIDKKYSEPHRFYHNQAMLAQKADLLNSVDVDSSIVFATIFQYFEFDVKVNSVEVNCQAFQEFLIDAGIEDEKLRNSVLKMLGDETVDSVDVDETIFEYFQDMDLAILGSPPDQYAQYVKLLQKEHELIGLSVYRNMRLKILQTFLTIPHIYMNQSFRDRFEGTARENIRREIEDLKGN